jgi:hypothetical protein
MNEEVMYTEADFATMSREERAAAEELMAKAAEKAEKKAKKAEKKESEEKVEEDA